MTDPTLIPVGHGRVPCSITRAASAVPNEEDEIAATVTWIGRTLSLSCLRKHKR
jgi:hypothetical protein